MSRSVPMAGISLPSVRIARFEIWDADTKQEILRIRCDTSADRVLEPSPPLRQKFSRGLVDDKSIRRHRVLKID